jgi:hypothetical protein
MGNKDGRRQAFSTALRNRVGVRRNSLPPSLGSPLKRATLFLPNRFAVTTPAVPQLLAGQYLAVICRCCGLAMALPLSEFPNNPRTSFVQSDNLLSQAFARLPGIMKLLDERTADGSRHFASLPKITPWEVVQGHVLLLGGAKLVNCVDRAPPIWLDFDFRGHRFVVHRHDNQIQLFVRDPGCSDLILYEVGRHFETVSARVDGRTEVRLPGAERGGKTDKRYAPEGPTRKT